MPRQGKEKSRTGGMLPREGELGGLSSKKSRRNLWGKKKKKTSPLEKKRGRPREKESKTAKKKGLGWRGGLASRWRMFRVGKGKNNRRPEVPKPPKRKKKKNREGSFARGGELAE